ncbi:hypothetical protein GCM10009069_05560 [Algimonas arctica]|uniref:Uncharacterized protein n=1 Tax=Algimonas arctica TaxID=1479486 RepID=A0A8J3CPB2_9PROT|nr:hypothetical protein GCM10009069_05560 [Algimonas arctica]
MIALERSAGAEETLDVLQEATLLQSESVILQSRNLRNAVVGRLELDERLKALPDWEGNEPKTDRMRRAADFVDEVLSVREQISHRTLRVAVVTPDPDISADIANAAADIFIEARAYRSQERREQDRLALEESIQTLRGELNAKEEKLLAEIEGSNVNEGGLSRTALLQQLIRAERQSSRMRIEAERLESLNPVLLAGVDPDLAKIRIERGRLQDEYKRLGEDLGPRHPRMTALKGQIDALDTQYQSEIAERRATARDAVEASLIEEADLQAQLEDTENGLRQSVQVEIATSSLKRDLDALYVQHSRAVEALAELQSQSPPDAFFTIRERAVVPAAPVTVLKPFYPWVGLVTGGFLGFILFALQDRLRDRVSHPRDVADKLGQKLIGVVPKEKSRGKVASAYFDPQAPIAEAAASIVARLVRKKSVGQALVIHITSTRSGEGKSTLALALARAFASTGDALLSNSEESEDRLELTTQSDETTKVSRKSFSGLRTLIIDADMRRPSFQTDSNSEIGLETVLKNLNLIDKAIRPTSNKALYLLPCNSVADNPAGLLAGNNFSSMINLLKPVLDVIVIDGPPSLGLADAALIGQRSDMSLYVVEQNRLRRDHVAASIERLEESGCKIGGVILTKFELAGLGNADMYRYTYGNDSYAYGDDKKRGLVQRIKKSNRSINLN